MVKCSTIKRKAQTLRLIGRELTALLRRRLPAQVCGVQLGRLLGPARRVRVTPLSKDDKVRLRGEQVLLDSQYLSRNYDQADERSRAACMLYFLHELIHLAQGIGAKKTVRGIRSAGAEHTLLHCDLHADHGAAGLLHRLIPEWSVPFLKDVQGYALAAFPSTAGHTDGAKQRKRLRVLAIRADYWARQLGMVTEGRQAGYLFVEYAQPRGPLLLYRSGPPLTLLGTVRLRPQEVAILDRASQPGKPLPMSGLDHLLIGILRRQQPPQQT